MAWHSLADASLGVPQAEHADGMQGRGLEHVDKATVKELVRQQIACEKPMFAPWYRDTENMSPRMRPRRPEWRSQSGPYPSHC